jgi:hypothetical protein
MFSCLLELFFYPKKGVACDFSVELNISKNQMKMLENEIVKVTTIVMTHLKLADSTKKV